MMGDTFTPFRECPHCGSTLFLPGPRGGASMNVTCAECLARFNVVMSKQAPIKLIEHLSGPRQVAMGSNRQAGVDLDTIRRNLP